MLNEVLKSGHAKGSVTPITPIDAYCGRFDGRIAGASAAATPAATLSRIFERQAFREIDVTFQPGEAAVWCMMQPSGRPSFTPALLSELQRLQTVIQCDASRDTAAPFDFLVLGSHVPGVFNLGGDLALFHACIVSQNWAALRQYAHRCVEVVFANHTGCGGRIISLGLIEGDALGGGFEAALSCDFLVAERQVKLGFPEVLFNLFPGMGAYSLLARRIGVRAAEAMLRTGKIYTATQLLEMGVLDAVVEKGEGRAAVQQAMLAMQPRLNTHKALYQVKRCVNPVTLQELMAITDIWVESAANLSTKDLRNMERIVAAQERTRRHSLALAS